MSQEVHLEKAAREFAEATAKPPFLFDLGPEKGRQTVDQVQSAPIDKPEVDAQDITAPDLFDFTGRRNSDRKGS